jgi:hypothetical protein
LVQILRCCRQIGIPHQIDGSPTRTTGRDQIQIREAILASRFKLAKERTLICWCQVKYELGRPRSARFKVLTAPAKDPTMVSFSECSMTGATVISSSALLPLRDSWRSARCCSGNRHPYPWYYSLVLRAAVLHHMGPAVYRNLLL